MVLRRHPFSIQKRYSTTRTWLTGVCFGEYEVVEGRRTPLVRRILRGRRSPAATRRPSDASFGHGGARRHAGRRPDQFPAPSAPLAGLRVLDFGVGGVGVAGGRLFAEYGADVIKVESRTYPDFMRVISGHGLNPSFSSSSRSKRAFGVNLKHPDGLDLVYELVARSDVIIENLSTGTMGSLKMGFRLSPRHQPQVGNG